MALAPLTHHDIIRRIAPLTQSGLKVNLAACDRAARYIEFEADRNEALKFNIIYSLEIDSDDRQILCRVLVHDNALVSTLHANSTDLTSTLEQLEQIPLSRQIVLCNYYACAHSYRLDSSIDRGNERPTLRLRFSCAQVGHLQVRVDTSTGGNMPADVRILPMGKTSSYLRDTLADGRDLPLEHRAARKYRLNALEKPNRTSLSSLPDDILAVLGPQWRPLRYQGDHWKGVLRQLGTRDSRTGRAEKFIESALEHLHMTFTRSPELYQRDHAKARWQVYIRRLQPIMVFTGILALMPISWFFVSSGVMTIHPLALGLTPLLMVGVVVLTAREIPVMEIPPRPSALTESAWAPSTLITHHADPVPVFAPNTEKPTEKPPKKSQ